MSDRQFTATDSKRAIINKMLETRSVLTDAAATMAQVMGDAAQLLISAASLDFEYVGAVDGPNAEPVAVNPLRQDVDGAARAVQVAIDESHSANVDAKAAQAVVTRATEALSIAKANAGVAEQRASMASERVQRQSAWTGIGIPSADALRNRAAQMIAEQGHAIQAVAPQHAPTHASTFGNVQTGAPSQARPPLPVYDMPASQPLVGSDATSKVYTEILRALSGDAVSIPTHAVNNWHAEYLHSGAIRVRIGLANAIVCDAFVGKSDKVWGKAISTTIRANPSNNPKRPRITYAPLLDGFDWGFYLVAPTAKAKGRPYDMPSGAHIAANASIDALRTPVNASENWRLSVQDGYLCVDFALATFANVVTKQRSPTWGVCVSTTRHPGSRRIAKTITLGPALVLMLDVIQRVKAR